ncbi:MAG TPA: uroporphyrinogen-III synthase [Polaromonas sp.]|uniref:uroporphyrinogen-III synthase n=1 Tax=Polaromonas sp. TaxID=1869339 RepID=UPI002D23718B|nr:uroporphyrinogen-III synthase [Polaromonas sp.]HYW58753.1 uroporphyrinogen-III synthase [Polaromonas sp.]
MKSARVIVTRPERDARRWVRDLQELGITAEALPLLEIAPLPPSEQLSRVWTEMNTYAALMFVSGNAVECFFESNMPLAQHLRAKLAIYLIAGDVRFLAPGPGTVKALRHAGVPIDRIDAPAADAIQFDSEALWAVVGRQDWQGRRVLIVRGQGAANADPAAPGRDWLARQFAAAGASVDFLAVYQRQAPAFSALQLKRIQAAASDGSVWLFSSSEAVAHLPPSDWSRARAVATHPRIAEAVRAAGWGVVAESRPALRDIVASIESM